MLNFLDGPGGQITLPAQTHIFNEAVLNWFHNPFHMSYALYRACPLLLLGDPKIVTQPIFILCDVALLGHDLHALQFAQRYATRHTG